MSNRIPRAQFFSQAHPSTYLSNNVLCFRLREIDKEGSEISLQVVDFSLATVAMPLSCKVSATQLSLHTHPSIYIRGLLGVIYPVPNPYRGGEGHSPEVIKLSSRKASSSVMAVFLVNTTTRFLAPIHGKRSLYNRVTPGSYDENL